MITAAKLGVFRKYNGNMDYWQHIGCPGSDVFPEHEWADLERFLQELAMYKRNLVRPQYADDIRRRLTEIAADEDVARQLMELA